MFQFSRKLYRNCNYRYTYEPDYVRSMSWKGTILATLCFIFSKYIWTIILRLNEGYGMLIAAVSLFYFMDSLYVDYIFCKYTYFGKYENIDKQARAGDWLSSIYFANLVLVLVGSIFGVFLFVCSWHLLAAKICFLLLLCVSVFLVLPIFQAVSRKSTLLWCILRVVLYGTVQRTGYLIAFIAGVYKLWFIAME